jgi:hypothetical protein
MPNTAPTKPEMTEAQRAYEAKRAAKAGMSLDKWLDLKRREKAAEQKAAEKDTKPPKKPGLLSRLIERGHKPLKKS